MTDPSNPNRGLVGRIAATVVAAGFIAMIAYGGYACAIQVRETKQTSIAYLQAVAAEDFERAHSLLGADLAGKIQPAQLEGVLETPRLVGLEKPKVHQTVGYEYGSCARASAKLPEEGRTPIFLWVKDGRVHDIYLPPKNAKVFTRKEGVWHCQFSTN